MNSAGMAILWRVCFDVDGGIISLQETSVISGDRPLTIAEASRKYLVGLYTDAHHQQETIKAVRNQFIE